MTKALTSFVLVAALTALSTALCLAVARHGYPFGMTGARRIEAMADAGAFLPLAAVYCLSALLMMVLPLRAASFVLLNAADTLFWTVLALLAAIVGYVAGRWAFGQGDAPWALWDWHLLFAAAVIAIHLVINELRRNLLLRSLCVAVFAAAVPACLFWSFAL